MQRWCVLKEIRLFNADVTFIISTMYS